MTLVFTMHQNKWVDGDLSDKDLFKRISSDLYTSRDRITGFTRVTYRHVSPYFAKEFLDNLIFELNDQMRRDDLAEYARAVDYLNAKLINEVVESQRAIISSLIQNYLQKETVASISDEYVLSSIEPLITFKNWSRKTYSYSIYFLGFLFSVSFSSLSCFIKIIILRNENNLSYRSDGFIGFHLSNLLCKDYIVTGIDNLNNYTKSLKKDRLAILKNKYPKNFF